MKNFLENSKGVALITILLIILAGMSISLSLTNNGIFNRAKKAAELSQNQTEYESGDLYSKAKSGSEMYRQAMENELAEE